MPNIYLHHYVGSDDDRACHDHRYWSVSILLKGRLREIIDCNDVERSPNKLLVPKFRERRIRRFIPVIRSAAHSHRLILESEDAWTVFFTGPRIRPWGFWCIEVLQDKIVRRWVYWRLFTDATGNGVGRGCD